MSNRTMRAARVHSYGPPENVVIDLVPVPEVQPGTILVKTAACAVNYPDVLLIANQYQVTIPTPFAVGSELAGVVEAVGDGLTGVSVGDHVFGGMFNGSFAEYTLLSSFTVIPPELDMRLAAAFGVAYLTSYHGLRSVAEVRPGDWVCVLGASGGVGLAAVELAKLMGGRVIAAASTDAKLEVCRQMGAEATINYDNENLKERLKEITGGHGADVVFDPVGGDYSEQALRSTAWGGRFVVVGFAAGPIPKIPLNLVLLKGPIIKGFELRTMDQYMPEESKRNRAELLDLLVSGAINPHISEVFPLSRAAEALRLMADRKVVGKVVIDPAS